MKFWAAATLVMLVCGAVLAIVGDTLFLAALIMSVVCYVKMVDA